MTNKQFLVLTASAGSGKTYALALRYVYLLLEGAKVGEILALTFSNKAADEMRERVGNFLLLLSSEGEEWSKKREELFDALKKEYAWEKDRIIKAIPSISKSYWSHSPKIITLDAFFNSIVRRFCWYVGVPHQFQIGAIDVDEVEENFFASLSESQSQKYIDLYFEQDKKDPFSSLNAMGAKFTDLSFEFPDRRGDVQASREKVMLYAEKLQKAVRAQTKSNEALNAVSFATIEEIFEAGKTWLEKGGEYRGFKKLDLKEELFEDLRSALIELFNAKEASFFRVVGNMLDSIQASRDFYFRKENCLDFIGVTNKAYELLCKQKISSDFFYFRLDDHISHILLDEFQDTSIIQYKILLPIIEEILAGEGRIGSRSFFAVGDEKQSIYRFRGGYGELLGIVRNLSSQITSESLNMNYRSAGEIVNFVNDVFGSLPPKSSKLMDYQPQESCKSGGYVKIHDAIHEVDMAPEAVKKEIDAFLSRGILLEEIAILVFNNKDAAILGDYLKNFFPISSKESVPLSEKKDAQLLISALECALHPKNPLVKIKLAKLLGRGLEDSVEVVKLCDLGRFVYRSMQLYSLNSAIAKQVLEIACKHRTYETFIAEVRFAKGNQDFQDGLKILTIHSSKGLQFNHMIVLDQLGGDNHAQDGFFVQYDKDLNGKLYIYEGKRKIVDRDYERVCEEEKSRALKESINLLYVALTRACESLVVIPVKGKGRSKFEDIGLLEGFAQGKNIYGEPINLSDSKNQPKFARTEHQIIQKKFGRQEGFVQKEKLPYAPNNLKAILRGQMSHKALELYLGYGANRHSLLCSLRNHYGAWIEESELEALLPVLAKTEALLKEHFTWSEVRSEVSFVQGSKLHRIDCLLLERDNDHCLKRVIILDYKSGRKDEANVNQVRFYVEAIRSQYPQVEVSGFLLYLNQFELVNVA